MSGGYKTWSLRELLTSPDLNTYLMSQTVPRFATTAARDTAITLPSWGQLIWVDSIGYQSYTGAAWITILYYTASAFSLSLANGYTTWGSGYATPGFRKVAGNRVHLEGLAKAPVSGTVNAHISTLPAGFIPITNKVYSVPYSGGTTRLGILSTGVISAYDSNLTNSQWISLDGVSFTAA